MNNLKFNWVGTMFRYDAEVYVVSPDMAIALYALYRKLDPNGVGNVYVESSEDGFTSVWRDEFGNTISEAFEIKGDF